MTEGWVDQKPIVLTHEEAQALIKIVQYAMGEGALIEVLKTDEEDTAFMSALIKLKKVK
jgi:hypothetical protein